MINRIGRIRETASKLLDKPTEKSAEHYRRQVADSIRLQFAKIGLDDTVVESEIEIFWRAVQAEAARQSCDWYTA
jgi:hypothetical protein